MSRSIKLDSSGRISTTAVPSTNLVLKTLDTPPAAHDEGIINSYHRNDIDPLLFKFVILGKIRGQVIRMASGLNGRSSKSEPNQVPSNQESLYRESTWHRDDYNLLSLPFVSLQRGS